MATIILPKQTPKVGRVSLRKAKAMDAQQIIKQDTVTDLTTFEEVILRKVGTFIPVATYAEGLERVKNDTERFIKVINDGLRTEAIAALAKDTSVAWQEYDEETKELKPFTGSPASKKVVNPLVLQLAKTIFKYSKEMKSEEKKAAKDKAREMIRTNPVMVSGLKETAMVEADDEE